MLSSSQKILLLSHEIERKTHQLVVLMGFEKGFSWNEVC